MSILPNFNAMGRDEKHCRHCDRPILLVDGVWIDPEATGDDSVWRETCDSHDTFTAEHEPVVPVKVTGYFATGRVPGPFRAVEAGPFETHKAAAVEGRRRRFGGLKVVARQVHPHDLQEFQDRLHEALVKSHGVDDQTDAAYD